MLKNMEISLLMDFYKDILTEKQQKVMELYYNEDFSLTEIANVVGITRQGVYDMVKRAEMQVYQLEDKLSLFKKFKNMRDEILEILNYIDKIDIENKKLFKSDNINKYVNDIKDKVKNLSS